MPPKKNEQEKSSEVLASTRERDYMLQALLARDARSETLANFILQRYGYCPREQERSEAEIIAEIEMLHDALSSDYGVPLPLIPTEDDVAEMHQDLSRDVESGIVWLLPAAEEILTLFNTALPELTAHVRSALSTQQSPASLAVDTLDQFVDQVLSPFLGLSGQEMDDGIRDHLRLVVQAVIAERQAQDYHALTDEDKKAWMRHALAQQVKDWLVNVRSYTVLRVRRNWVAPGEHRLVRRSDGTIFFEPSPGCPPPPGELPTLTFTLNPLEIDSVGVTELAKEFTISVNKARKKLPAEWDTFPKELAFLRTIRWQKFERDLRRFDLHMKYDLTFREIAFLEDRERQGYPLPSKPQHHTIGKAILGEDGVEKSVKKLIQAIGRKPKAIDGKRYQARRRRSDTPAQGQGPYYCETHPLECPKDCRYLKEWMRKFNATVPTDSTGRGKEIVACDDVIRVEEAQERKQLRSRRHLKDHDHS